MEAQRDIPIGSPLASPSPSPEAIENPLTPSDPAVANLTNWLMEFRSNLTKIGENNSLLDGISSALSQSVTRETDKTIGVAIKKITLNNAEFFKENKRILALIKALDNAKSSSISAEAKTIISQNFTGLIDQNKRLMLESNKRQRSCQNQIKARVKKQLKAVDGGLTEEEIDRAVEDTKGAEKIIYGQLLGGASVQMLNQVEDIKEKYKDIELLEKNVLLLNDLIGQMALLVEEQGETLGRVETNVGEVKVLADKGTGKLVEAKEIMEEAQTKKCCLLLIIIGAIVVVTAPILLSILNARNII